MSQKQHSTITATGYLRPANMGIVFSNITGGGTITVHADYLPVKAGWWCTIINVSADALTVSTPTGSVTLGTLQEILIDIDESDVFRTRMASSAPSFGVVAVGMTNVTAEVASDTLSIVEGDGASVSANPTTGLITISAPARKLDDLAAPDDNTDLNATDGRHGLLPKLSWVATQFLNGQGGWTVPAGGGGAAPIPAWDDETEYNQYSTVIQYGNMYEALVDGVTGGSEPQDRAGMWVNKYPKLADIYEEFLDTNAVMAGGLTAAVSGTGASASAAVTSGTFFDAETTIGVRKLTTGTTTTGRAAIGTVNNLTQMCAGANQITSLRSTFAIPDVSTSAQRFIVYSGFMDSVSDEPQTGLYFSYKDDQNSGMLQFVIAKNGARTAINTDIEVVYGQMSLEIILFARGCVVFSGGNFVGEYPEADYPLVYPGNPDYRFGIVPVSIIKSAGSTARSVEIDSYRITTTRGQR